MNEDDDVRRAGFGARGPESGIRRPEPGDGRHAADEDIDRALASLTDVSPSPTLARDVMRRVVDARAAASPGGYSRRVALAVAAVVMVAVATWLTTRPGPIAPAGQGMARDVTLPAAGGNSAGSTNASSEAETSTAAVRRPKRPRPKHSAVDPFDDVTAAMPPIELRPIPDAAPVTLTPLTMNALEIPEIEIRPLDEPPDEVTQPNKEKPDKRQPGGPGTIR